MARARPRQPAGAVDLVDDTFAAALGVLQEASWAPWWSFLKPLFGLPLDAQELDIFRQCTGRAMLSAALPAEAFVIVGRRGGKSRIAAFGAAASPS